MRSRTRREAWSDSRSWFQPHRRRSISQAVDLRRASQGRINASGCQRVARRAAGAGPCTVLTAQAKNTILLDEVYPGPPQGEDDARVSGGSLLEVAHQAAGQRGGEARRARSLTSSVSSADGAAVETITPQSRASSRIDSRVIDLLTTDAGLQLRTRRRSMVESLRTLRSSEVVHGFDRDGPILSPPSAWDRTAPHDTSGNVPRPRQAADCRQQHGRRETPDWYLNLLANQLVTVEAPSETFQGVATPLVGDDRDRAWRKLVAEGPHLVEHQASTARTLPIVAITRA